MVMTLLCFLIGMAAAASGLEDSAAVKKISISGKLEFETSEMMRARTMGAGGIDPGKSQLIDHVWYGHATGTFNLEGNPLENFKVRAGFEFRQYRTMVPLSDNYNRDRYFGQSYWNGFYIREGQGIYSFLKSETAFLDLAFGYLPYKYNSEVRNLGEFLFRSGTYPLYLTGEFDRPFARLTGLCLSLKSGNEDFNCKFDWLALLERDIRPVDDISLAAIASVNILKMVEIGGGVDLARVIPVDSRLTTSREAKNEFYIYNSDSTQIDTSRYTFKGTKLMARATIDPFGMVRGNESIISEIVGDHGGKIYGEYSAIGLENYPANEIFGSYNPRGYGKLSERSPWMVGITFPLWKILDVCALEFERWPSNTPDTYFRPVMNGFPEPAPRGTPGGEYDSSSYVPRWNWSLYMKKQIVKHFGLICQMGRDHQRWEFNPNEGLFYDFESAYVKPNEWGWHLSGVFSF